MKKKSFFLILVIGVFFTGCQTLITAPQTPTSIKTIEVDQEIVQLLDSALLVTNAPNPPQYVCGTIPIPKYLKELNRNDVFTSNISLSVGSSLNAYGFSGTMAKKDVLVVAYLTKFKDYNCGSTMKRVQVGLKLYVHASELKIKTSSPTLPMIAAAVELGLAKAEYRFETFGLNPDDFYAHLPSAQFTVDTYSKVISSYDNIVHSLKDSTEIDPIISDVPKLKTVRYTSK